MSRAHIIRVGTSAGLYPSGSESAKAEEPRSPDREGQRMSTILSSPLLKLPQASPRGERPARRRKTVEVFTYGKIGETGNERDEAAQACTQGRTRESSLGKLDAAGTVGGLLRASTTVGVFEKAPTKLRSPPSLKSSPSTSPSDASTDAAGAVNSVDPLRPPKASVSARDHHIASQGMRRSPLGQLGSPEGQPDEESSQPRCPRTEAVFDAARHEKQMRIVRLPSP